MAYNEPASRGVNDQITATIWNADIRANAIAIYAGGMSVASQATGDILTATSATQLLRIAAVATGSVLVSQGTGVAPVWRDNPTLTGVLTITGYGTNDFSTAGSGVSSLKVRNSTSDGGAGQNINISAGTAQGYLTAFSQGYTTTNFHVANGLALECETSGGICIAAWAAAGRICFTTGGTAEVAQFDAQGRLGVGVVPELWHSQRTVIQLGDAGFMNWGDQPANGGSMAIGNNMYFDGGDRATTTGYSQILAFNVDGTGKTQLISSTGTTVADAVITSHVSGPYTTAGGVDWTSASDSRLKSGFTPLTTALSRVLQMNIGTYTWTQTARPDIGLLAQEVNTLFPEIVDVGDDGAAYDPDAGTDVNGLPISSIWGVRESKYGVIALAAIQEQQATITALTARIAALETA